MATTKMATTCIYCGGTLVPGRFDVTFRTKNGREASFLSVPAYFCTGCKDLVVDEAILKVLGVDDSVCVFAIENDLCLLEKKEPAS